MTVGALILFTGSAPATSVKRLTEEQRALHVLNRLGYGPRPGDVEKVLEIGVDRYIALQLHPERIDDTRVDERLERLDVPNMTERELYETFQKPYFDFVREGRVRQTQSSSMTEEDAAREMREARARIPMESRPRRVVQELAAAKVIRAVESERQLEEVMVDFWMNHFNVSADKNLDRFLIANYERDVIRPNIWGSFEDLLMATAKSPAMLVYLDNARSVAVEANRSYSTGAVSTSRVGARGMRSFASRQSMRRRIPERVRNAGLNENYARELLELHTLGVDGGYTQKDVTELARVLTGWSIDGQRDDRPVSFTYRQQLHDVMPKSVIGYSFGSGGGIEEGERMIHVLAHHPSTAKRIATKLCQKLVADEPPAALVDRVAKRFLETGGDLRSTVETVITSSEFFDPRYYRAKTKTPLEYVVSAIRAVDGSTDGRSSSKAVADMGQPLYLCQPPTGYSEAAEDWISSGALLARLNYSISLAANRAMGTRVGPARSELLEGDLLDGLATRLIGGDLSSSTRATIERRLSEEEEVDHVALATGLILGSPEFQRQ